MVKAETEVDFLQNFQGFQGILARRLENLTFFGQFFKKRKRKLIFLEIFKASSLNFSSFHGILAKSLKNKPFFLKKLKRKWKIQGFLVKILQICKVFTPPTGYSTAARLLLRFYVTIFLHFQAKVARIKVFSCQKSSNLQGFYTPNRICNSWRAFIAFLGDNVGHFKAK